MELSGSIEVERGEEGIWLVYTYRPDRKQSAMYMAKVAADACTFFTKAIADVQH